MAHLNPQSPPSKMRIAQIAPLILPIPPTKYGAVERIVFYLTLELIRQGHDVTLFASADSETPARLIAACKSASLTNAFANHIMQLGQLSTHRAEFDIIHFHLDAIHFPICRLLGVPNITTCHNVLTEFVDPGLWKEFDEVPLAFVSKSQQSHLATGLRHQVVYNGIPESLYRPNYEEGQYLVYLGRIQPEKGLDDAIRIARRSNALLKIGGSPVQRKDYQFFKTVIEPQLHGPLVEYIGEVDDKAKEDLLSHARALLFPVKWQEPFGLVMIESLACGTPVIAYRCGSTSEILENGVTGFLVEDADAAIEAVDRLPMISRFRCRSEFEARFTASRMTNNYVNAYHKLVFKEDRMS